MAVKQIRVLLIEDNPGDIRLSREMLGEDPAVDWEIEGARTLEQGQEALAEDEHELILLDLSLPDSQGIETFRRLQENDVDIPVVILTGRDDPRIALEAVQEGAQDYLIKDELTPSMMSRSLQYAVERFHLKKSILELSITDNLTGLLNRRGFFTLADQQVKLVRRTREALTLFFIDIDQLKSINDHYGHKSGDRAIRAAGQVLRYTFRESDLIARMGGDEFAVLAIGASSDEQGLLYKRLQERLKAINKNEQELPFSLSLSVGAASWKPDQTKSLDRLLSEADRDMYAHKKAQTTIEPPAPVPTQPVREKPPFVVDSLDLLLVEDNPGDARLVEEYLGEAEKEIRITQVDTLAAVRDMEGKDTFSVILLDLSLPDSHGISTVEGVREVFPEIPVVVFTGRDENQVAIRALKAGAQDYLIKGKFDNELLDRALHYAVERHQLRRKNQSYFQEIQRSEQILQSIFDHVQIGIFRVNPEGKLIFANQALLDLTGHQDLAEATGEMFFETHFHWGARFVRDVFSGRRTVSGEVVEMTTESGENIPVRLGINRTSFDGVPILQGTVEDISKAVESERMIRMQASALEAAANAIMITDREGTILWCNPAFTDLTGYSGEEAVGSKPRLLSSGKQGENFYRQMWGTISAGRVWQGELINQKKNGILYTERMTITPLENEDGEVYRFIAIKEDISQIKDHQRILQRRLEEVTLIKDVASAGIRAENEDELLGVVTELVGETFYPDHFGMLMISDDRKSLIVNRNYQGLPEELMEEPIPLEKGVVGRVARTGEPALLGDVSLDEDYYSSNPEIESQLCVPLVVDRQVVGLINTESTEPDDFTEDDLRLLSTIAGQLATAISNLRHQKRERAQRQIAESLSENALILNSSLDLNDVLDRILDQIADFVPYQAASLLLTNDGKGEVFQHRGYQERNLQKWIEKVTVDLEDPQYRIYERMIKEMEPVLIPDTTQSGDWVEIPEIDWVRSYLGIPLEKNGSMIGVINLDHSEPDAFNEDNLDTLIPLANQIATAVDNARLYRKQERQVNFLESLRQIDFAITGSMDLQVTLDVIMMEMREQLDVDAINILLYEESSFQLESVAWRGLSYPDTFPDRLHLSEGLCGAVVQQRSPVLVPEIQRSDFLIPREDQFTREGIRGYYGIPLIAKGKIVGVLELFRRATFSVDPQWEHYAETVATQTAIAIDNAHLFDNLQGAHRELSLAYESTLEGWAGALELRDQETEGHSRRVVNLTMQLVRKLDLPKRDWAHTRRGALLHDIGKMGVPDTILQKPGKLSEQEWEVMRKHPLYAKQLLEQIEYLKPALDIPLHHHEKWDGSGYPSGLAGEEIPLAARIFAVVDVYDALLSDRPYRDAWPEQKVIQHIRDQAGSHFDPQVVGQFLDLVTGDHAVNKADQGRGQS